MVFTWKRGFKRRRLPRRMSSRKRSFKRSRTSRFRRKVVSKLRKIITRRRPHYVLDRQKDRDHFIITQQAQINLEWGAPSQAGTIAGQRSDGFLLSMNGLLNVFEGPGLDTTHYGLPITTNTAGVGFRATAIAQSGNFDTVNNLHVPDSLASMFSRYNVGYVTRGIMILSISQDTQGTADRQGSTKIGVLGLPSPPDNGEILQGTGNAHWMYPWGAGTTLADRDMASFAGLQTEANARVRTLTPFAGSQTKATIRYPFLLNKYCPPGYWTDDQFYQTGTSNINMNPNFLLQPRILIQLATNGVQTNQMYRLEIRYKWYITTFERLPTVTLP